MLAVAAVAVALGAWVMWRRSQLFRDRALYHEMLMRAPVRGVNPAPPGFDPADYNRRWWAYHAGLRHKYDRAARYPWLPVPLDPRAPSFVDTE
jgi:hypothetical protein